MNTFTLFLGLALGFGVVLEVLQEVSNLAHLRYFTAISRTFTVALASGAAWAMNYSVFAAAHTDVRTSWMGYVATGLALVGTGEVLRAIWPSVGKRTTA